jgi:iron uptake system component EfeO
MPARATALPLLLAPLVAGLVGCSGGDVKQTVGVTIKDNACTLDTDTIDAGKTAFDVSNDSGREAEAYVYAAGDKKVDEVEGIADGTSRKLTVSLDAGSYEFACKPEGKDVRAPFTVR